MNGKEYVNPERASRMLKVCPTTLAIWENNGQIKAFRTAGRHRRYLVSDILRLQKEKGISTPRKRYCYARVSSKGQKEDLDRQIEFFRGKFDAYECLSDIGSGLNFKRKNFNAILDQVLQGNVEEIVVTHRDRLCRFGFELIERLVTQFNGKIVVLDQEKTSPEQELVKDLLSIVTVFSGRLYGLRAHSIKKAIKHSQNNQDTVIADEGGETGTDTNVRCE